MKQRIITGIFLGLILLPLLIVDELFLLFQILMIVLAFVATLEMIKLFETEKKFPGKSKIFIIVFTILIYLSALADWVPKSLAAESLKLFNIYIGFFPMLLIGVMTILALLVLYEDFDGNTIGKTFTTINYIGLSFACLTILRYIGLRFIVYLFIITIFTDVFAYFVGVKFGKNKMAPKISPKKTWEGAIGGTLVASIVGVCFAYFYGYIVGSETSKTIFHDLIMFSSFEDFGSFVQFLIVFIITVSASIIGQIGDLVASKLKRTYNLKDFGNIFPGHGGVLDRFDSALFVALFLICVINVFSNIVG